MVVNCQIDAATGSINLYKESIAKLIDKEDDVSKIQIITVEYIGIALSECMSLLSHFGDLDNYDRIIVDRLSPDPLCP